MSKHAILDALTPVECPVGGTANPKLYKVAEVRALPGVVFHEPISEVYVAVLPPADGGVSVAFAAFEWVAEDDDGGYASLMFRGDGTGGNLRELRHTYWGPERDGYVFYMHLAKTIAALGVLKTYFDD